MGEDTARHVQAGTVTHQRKEKQTLSVGNRSAPGSNPRRGTIQHVRTRTCILMQHVIAGQITVHKSCTWVFIPLTVVSLEK